MAAGTLTSRITGLLRVVVAAAVMGVTTSRLADAYNLANTAPNQFYELALGGILTAVLVPVFVEALAKKSETDAWRDISNVFWVGLALGAVASIVLALIAPVVIGLTGPDLDPQARGLAVSLLRLFGAQVFFYTANALLGGILYAKRRFGVPAFVPALNNVVVIVVFLAFGKLLANGPTTNLDGSMTLLLGLGTTAGVAVMALANLPALRGAGIHLGWHFSPFAPVIKTMLRLGVWLAAYVATNQVGLIVIQRLASQAEGSYTAWVQASMFFQLPIGLLATSVTVAMMPGLSQAGAANDLPTYRARFSQAVGLTIFLLLPASIGIAFLGEPIIQLLLQRGQFNAQDTILVGRVLRYLAIGLAPFGLFLLILQSFYALKDTRTPFVVNLIARGLAIAGMFAIFAAAGVDGLAIIYSASFAFACILGWILLHRKVGGIETKRLAAGVGKVVIACIPLTAVLLLIDALVGDPSSDLYALAEVGIGVLVGAGTYVLAAHGLGIDEVRQLRVLVSRKLGHSPNGHDKSPEHMD